MKDSFDMFNITLTDAQLEKSLLEGVEITEALSSGIKVETHVIVRHEHNLLEGYTEGFDGFKEHIQEAYVRMEYYDFRDLEKRISRFVYIDTSPYLIKKFIRNPQRLINVLQSDLSYKKGLIFNFV